MHKGKAGLQKEVSKIFTGIRIPKKDAPENNAPPASAGPAKYIPPKPAAPAPKPFTIPEPTQHSTAAPATKPAVYEPKAPAPVSAPPRGYEPPPAPAPVSAPSRQPKHETLHSKPVLMPLLKILERIKGKLGVQTSGGNQGRKKVMILMMPVLAVVFIIVLVNVLRSPSGTSAKNAQKSDSSADVAAFNGKVDWVLPPLYPDTLRDPMSFASSFSQAQAGAQAQETTARPVVKGIVYSDDNPCAVVGDRIVNEGDVVDGATVVKINPNSVDFVMGDKKWTQKVER